MTGARSRMREGAPEARRGTRLLPYTVSELNSVADSSLRTSIGAAWVSGEVVKFLAHRSGHWYFQLADADAVVSCAMFRSRNSRTPFEPRDGMEVLVHAAPAVYAAQGRYQLIVETIEPRGKGAAALALEQLREKLAGEGLFDASRKRTLPLLPCTIGIATSVDGAAVEDVLRVLRRRFA